MEHESSSVPNLSPDRYERGETDQSNQLPVELPICQTPIPRSVWMGCCPSTLAGIESTHRRFGSGLGRSARSGFGHRELEREEDWLGASRLRTCWFVYIYALAGWWISGWEWGSQPICFQIVVYWLVRSWQSSSGVPNMPISGSRLGSSQTTVYALLLTLRERGGCLTSVHECATRLVPSEPCLPFGTSFASCVVR